MSVREFDGASVLTLTGGALGAIANGALSIIVVGKPLTAHGSTDGYVGLQVGGGSIKASLGSGGVLTGGRLALYSDTNDSRADVGADTTWQILGLTKASGTVAPRFHRKQLGAGSWAQVDGGATAINETGSIDRIDIGAILGSGGLPADIRIGTVAVFAAELSDANVQSIQTTPSTQQLATLGAVGLWDLNQASTATAVEDLVGTFDQSGLTGTTVAGGDDPPGWTFGIGGGGGGSAILRSRRMAFNG
jgi:hypothetical protein